MRNFSFTEKVIIFVFFLVIFHLKVFSQAPEFKAFNLKNALPTSPEAAMLGRFGDVPVGAYTGTADISIPLYTIKQGGIEIPIVLRYHGSGNKVEDQASNVGLGWSLDPGGAIIQIITGKEDGVGGDNLPNVDAQGYFNLKANGVTGVLSFRNQVGTQVFDCDNGSIGPGPNDDLLVIRQALESGYGQPDIYQYSFPGYSGKFFINPETHQFVLLDKKAEVKLQGGPTGWSATTDDGNLFSFTSLETASGQIISEYSGRTFKLSSIRLHNGKEIVFEYVNGYYTWNSFSETFKTPYLQTSQPNFPSQHPTGTVHNTKNLSRIVTDNEIIVFNLEDRIDMFGAADNDGIPSNGSLSTKRIKSVDIFTPQMKKIKSFLFTYSYFDYVTTGGGYVNSSDLDKLGKRLRLDAVQEVGYDESGIPVYNEPSKFEYDQTLLPLKSSYARDFWGYYNGRDNSRLLPNSSFFYYAGFYHTNDVTPFADFYQLEPGLSGNCERAPDKAVMMAGTLKRITYPTKGSSVFTYEANTFGKYQYPNTERLNQTRIQKNLIDYNDPARVDETNHIFTLHRSVTVKFTNTFNGGTYDFWTMQPSKVVIYRVYNSGASPIKTFQMVADDMTAYNANNHSLTKVEYFTIPYEPNATYLITTEMSSGIPLQSPPSTYASTGCSFSFYIVPKETAPVSYGGGIRVASIKNFDADGGLLGTREYSYIKEDGTTSGVLMSPLTIWTWRKMAFQTHPGAFNFPVAEGTMWFTGSESATPFSSAAGGNVVGYSRVEERQVDPLGNSNGKKVYHFYNVESATAPDLPEDADLMNGSLLKEEIYDNGTDLKSSTTYTYDLIGSTQFSGYKSQTNFIQSFNCHDWFFYMADYPSYAFGFLSYPLNSEWYVLRKKETKQFSAGRTFSSIENYQHNARGQVIKINTSNSGGETIESAFTYPADITNPSNMIAGALRNMNLYNSILEENTLKNGTIISSLNYNYTWDSSNGNQMVINDIERSFNGVDYEKPVQFVKYDGFKNPLQINQKGTITSLLRSVDGSDVIAEIKNGSIDQVAFASFELNEKATWTFDIAGVGSSEKRTGQRSFSLTSSRSISKSGLLSSKTYVVAYWSKNATAYGIAGTVGIPVRGLRTIDGWTYYEHQITGQGTITITGTGHIDELRLYPNNAQMSTYTYLPLVGITSVTDSNGQSSFFEYDVFGRLVVVKNNNKEIVRTTDYHYRSK